MVVRIYVCRNKCCMFLFGMETQVKDSHLCWCITVCPHLEVKRALDETTDVETMQLVNRSDHLDNHVC